MKKIYKSLGLTCAVAIAISFWACEKKTEPAGPCDDDQWATAVRNGEARCLGEVEVTYWFPNTESAKIIMTAGNEMIGAREIDVEFSIPVEGLMLNTPYPVLEGKILGADQITEGSITFLVFDLPAQGKAGCIAGTFQLKAAAPGAPATFEYTDGKFVYYKGTVRESDFGTADNSGCNPFK
jgi:hypothetical protein